MFLAHRRRHERRLFELYDDNDSDDNDDEQRADAAVVQRSDGADGAACAGGVGGLMTSIWPLWSRHWGRRARRRARCLPRYRSLSTTMSSPPVSERASQPSDDDIEAVIKQATSSRPSPPGGPLPGKDTRTQLFVGNVSRPVARS